MAEVYLCDDNELDRRRLAKELDNLAKRNFIDLRIREFAGGEELLQAWAEAERQPDMIFLDIYMDGMDGMHLARTLRQSSSRVPILFTTSSEEHGIEAFSVFAGGYLCKPYTSRQLYEAVKPYVERMEAEMRCLSVMVRRMERTIPLREICCFEADGHSTCIHTVRESLKCSADIGNFRQKLADEPAFMACGRSYLVNLYHVKGWSGNAITLRDGSMVYMPQRLTAALKKYMEDFLHGNDLSL